MATQSSALSRALDNRHLLGFLFLLPAAALLIVFLTYPLGLGTWLGFTDARSAVLGEWIGFGNYAYLWGDAVMRLAVFNTLFYTFVASVIKFGLGLWLALLLNKHIPFKAAFRAVVLLPFIVPTALSAIAFWWIYDSQFSIISWTLEHWGSSTNISISSASRGMRASRPSPPTSGAASRSWRSACWPGCRLSRLRTTRRQPRRCVRLAAVPLCDPAAADADHRGGHDVLGALHVYGLPADLRADARRPAELDPPDGDALVPAGDLRWQPGRRRGDRHRDGALPARGDHVSYYGLQRRAWQQGGSDNDIGRRVDGSPRGFVVHRCAGMR